ncbi:MAG: FAD-dependent oxidoreductase [Proteobacteria bacterium]|nr:MAG: FAD-dependent oxidoreductase [Pseudomonadota bacterium]
MKDQEHRSDPRSENRSVWVFEDRAAAGEPLRPAASLAGRHAADIAVVGGGFTGVSTAWHLRQRHPELGIALVEARVLGHGASGRNGGQVLHGVNGHEPATPDAARRVHAATQLGIDLAEQLAARYARPGTFRRRGCLEIYTSARRAEAAHARAEALRAAGIPAEFVPATSLRVQGACGAILDPLAGRLDGYGLLQAMRPVLVESGVALFERTPALRIRTGAEIAIETPQGELRARSLVLATNAYTPSLGFFANGILPLHSHVLATAPLADDDWKRIGWDDWDGFSDDLDRIAFACRTPGGRLLFGGGGNAAYDYRFGGATEIAVRAGDGAERFLRGALARYFPALAATRAEHRWAGALAITLDRVCSMGVGGPHRNVYHALGYSGHGVALALLAGRVLADLYDDHHEPWRDLPFYQKRLPPLPPEPLRWLGYQAYTRITGRSPRKRAQLR